MLQALTSLASRLWQPWIAIAVLAVGLLVMLVTSAVQLRGMAAAARGLLHRDGRSQAWGLLAVGCGAGGLGAGALAVQWGGRGAVVWMWIAMLLAMGWRFAEGVLRASMSPAPDQAAQPAKAGAVARVWSFATIAAALATAGIFGGQQTGELLEHTWNIPALQAAIGFGVAAAIAVTVPAARRIILMAVPVALVAWLIVALMLMFADDLVLSLALGDAYNEAFGVRPVLTGAVIGGVSHALAEGVLAASLSGAIGQGAVQPRSARAAMLAPLCSIGLVASLGALVVTTEPALVSLSSASPVPLELHHSRGLRPSQQVGQTVVLPSDSPLVAGETYGFMVRSNPRGMAFGPRLDAEKNAVILPAWQVTENTTEVVFRMREKDPLAKIASWDIHVPCTREVFPGGNGGPPVLVLKPVNPDLELKKLIAYYELNPQPYVPTADFHFVGKVARAQSPDETLGDHLAMYEAEGADRLFNPKLHEFFRAGYRGPYAETEEQRPPWGLIAPAGFDHELGEVLDLRMVASPRGEPFVRLNRTGGVEAPPWDLLTSVRELVVQHVTDPELDIVIPVTAKLDGFRLRFTAKDEAWADFRKLAKMPEYRPTPFVRVRDVDFVGEVHNDARLAPEHAGRRTIVPHHLLAEPQGPYGEVLPYKPHPIELVVAGMQGPVVARDGAARIAGRLAEGGPRWAGHLTALAMLVLGVGGIVGSSGALGQDASSRRTIGLAIAAAASLGGAAPWLVAQSTAAVMSALAILAAAAFVLANLGRIRQASKTPDPE